MNNVVAFSASARGYLHIKKDIPCQDSSGCYEDPDGRYYAIAVADGHGDPTCMRSDRGSRIVVDVALDCLHEFADSCLLSMQEGQYAGLLDELLVPGHSEDIVRRLSDALLARWYDAVLQDLDQEPFTDEELERAGSFAALYQSGRELEHAYGTTLIAALMIDDLLLLLQQGDGRCVLLHEDGSASEPIPWDARCHENVTTSVSDTDAAESVRHAIVRLYDADPRVVACLLGSDGVEDAFRNEEGRWDYHRRLCMKLTEIRSAKSRRADFEQLLADELPVFSEDGSGDDVSVAGLADIRSLMMCRDHFDDLIDEYGISERLLESRAKLLSMERMHVHLEQAARTGSEEDVDAFLRYDAIYKQVEEQTQALSENLSKRNQSKKG